MLSKEIDQNRKPLIKYFSWTCVVFPLILQVKVKIEIAGNVDDVHPVDEDEVEGHHDLVTDDGGIPVSERIQAGSVENKINTVNSCSVLLFKDEH